MENKIASLMENEAFVAELEKAETMEAVAALFEREGVNLSEEELKAYLSDSEGETLAEEDLDEVAGGSIAGWIGYQVAKKLIKRYVSTRGSSGRGHSGGGRRG